jgi:hypothetical protein
VNELLTLRAVVEASPDEVAAVLLDVRPGGRSPLAAEGTVEESGPGDAFVVVRGGSHLTVSVDRAARSVTQQGEWWFRGVTEVEPGERGSLLVHRVFNVAQGHGWAVRFVARGPLNAAPGAFAETVRVLGERLGVATRLLD